MKQRWHPVDKSHSWTIIIMSNKKESVKSGALTAIAVAVGSYGINILVTNGSIVNVILAFVVVGILVAVDRYTNIGTIPITTEQIIEAIEEYSDEIEGGLKDRGIEINSDNKE